jgi:toxin ParE1/3/4
VPALVPEWRRAAHDDLLAIVDYISDDNPAAAQALKDEIETKVSRLPAHPKLYRAGRVPGTREMVVRGNYLVIYAEDENAISVLRVLHGAQQWPPERE